MDILNSFLREELSAERTALLNMGHNCRGTMRPSITHTSYTGCSGRRASTQSAPSSPGCGRLRRSHSAHSVISTSDAHTQSTSLPCTPRVQDTGKHFFVTSQHRSHSMVATTSHLPDHGDSTPPASDSESSFIDLETTKVQKWTEYTARKSIVKFRNRRAAKRARIGKTLYEVPHPPSVAVHQLLHNEYDKCRSDQTSWTDRLAAVLYCWFFGWIQDVYSSLTDNGAERSLAKWVLACTLVTSAALLCLVLTVIMLHLVVTLAAALTHAALNFVLLITSSLLLLLGLLTATSFNT